MPTQPLVTQALVWQGSDAMLLARLRSVLGSYVTQASITAIQLTVYDRNSVPPMNVIYTAALSIPAVVFDTLQPYDGLLWTIDKVGYNFKVRVPGASAFPLARDYDVVAVFTLNDGTTFPAKWECSAESNQ